MSPRRHALVAVAAVVALLAPAGALAAAAEGEQTTAFEVDDAQLAWGLNDESNNRAFAPGTFNFLAAGAVPDPGKGGQRIVAPGVWQGTATTAWRARDGDVTIEKRRPDGGYARATFAGLSTTADGSAIPGTTGPEFSGHRVVLDGGAGTVDPEAGTAVLRWTGAFSVVYYSGFTFFTVTDPVLRVTKDAASLTAVVAGYAADRDDPSTWTPVAGRRVTLADLPRAAVDLDAEDGFSVQPAYLGVTYPSPPQVRSGAWGAFPRSFLDQMDRVGSAAFWYSSGGSADPFKQPKPLTLSWSAQAPVAPPSESPAPTTPAEQPTTTVNPEPPAATPTPTAAPVQPAPPPLPAQPPPAPAAPSAPPAAADVVTAAPAAAATTPVYALDPVAGPSRADVTPDHRWTWWAGGALLLGAAALTLAPVRRRPRSKGSA